MTNANTDYLPVYFQATLGAGPLGSAVKMLPSSLIIAPFALVSNLSIHVLQKYRPTILAGWALLMIGFGVLSLLKAGDPMSKWVGYQIIAAMGTGILVSDILWLSIVRCPLTMPL